MLLTRKTNMYSKAYVVMRQTSIKSLPNHKIVQVSIRHHSTQKIVKLPLLAFKEDISVRNMTKNDLKMVMDWAAGEGWNPGKHEIDPLYAVDPNGYKVLEVN